MACSLASVALAVALGSTGGLFDCFHRPKEGGVMPPGPGYGWGFPNGNPDGYGWHDTGAYLPLGANRTPEYYFPRYYSVPAEQLLLQSYFNPYLSRGQRYIPYAGCGGAHPAGGPPTGSALLPSNPTSNPWVAARPCRCPPSAVA